MTVESSERMNVDLTSAEIAVIDNLRVEATCTLPANAFHGALPALIRHTLHKIC